MLKHSLIPEFNRAEAIPCYTHKTLLTMRLLNYSGRPAHPSPRIYMQFTILGEMKKGELYQWWSHLTSEVLSPVNNTHPSPCKQPWWNPGHQTQRQMWKQRSWKGPCETGVSGATSTEYIFNGFFSFFVNRVNFSVVVKDLISLLPSRVPDTPQTWRRKEAPVSKLQIFGLYSP